MRKSIFTKTDYLGTLGLPVAATLVGLVILCFQTISPVIPALIWSFCCLAVGALVGFLFGIPKIIQQVSSQPPGQQPSYKQLVNTNLEQISDWLTKIIIGIGLVELRRFPDLLNRASEFIAKGLSGKPEAKVLAAAIIIFFLVQGFFNSYLTTRMYLTGAFLRADNANESGATSL